MTDQAWCYWGQRKTVLPEPMAGLLAEEFGVDINPSEPKALDAVEIPASRLDDHVVASLSAVVGDRVSTRHAERVLHSTGKSYIDLCELRSGVLDAAVDGVLYPETQPEIAALLVACAQHDVAVVPYGGGTSVVGGIDPITGDHRAVISLDMRRIRGIVDVNRESEFATVRAGTGLVDFETGLNGRGYTLGHFPQSYEYATVGGSAATRSAGQASTGFGRFDEMILGLHCTTPAGDVSLAPHPTFRPGPSVLEIFVGSEGTLGVIDEVTLKIHRRSTDPRYEGWSFPTFVDGMEGIRALAQSGVAPDVVRLSDEPETRISMRIAGGNKTVRALGEVYLRTHGQNEGCLAIIGWCKEVAGQTSRRAAVARILGRGGGVPLGAAAGESWNRHRFEGPSLRDALMDHGILVETVETATTWSNLLTLRRACVAALTEALRDGEGRAPLVGCHLSHVYHSGASLYFTVMVPAWKDGRDLWARAKATVTEAIMDNGGTLTHHHSVGTVHAPYMAREIGERSLELLEALRQKVDPAAIMNPGKLTREWTPRARPATASDEA